MQAHPAYIPLSKLRDACTKRNLFVRMQIFDGGETVRITNNEGKQLLLITREYGQTENACAAAMQWLIEHDYIMPGDIEEG